jgi:choline kinase/phosphohistidine swiveling domain-containing protein
MKRGTAHESGWPQDLDTVIPSNRVVILGAGQGVRGLRPTALTVLKSGCRLLDWLLHAFHDLEDRNVVFVGGYRSSSVINEFQNIQFVVNEQWKTTGPIGSLAVAPLQSQCATYVTYCDVVFRQETVRKLTAETADVVVAIDRLWRQRYSERGFDDLCAAEKIVLQETTPVRFGNNLTVDAADAEFVGVLKLSPRAADVVANLIRIGRCTLQGSLPDLLTELLREDLSLTTVDVNGEWAELNAPQDLARFVLGTKAESLERLRPLVRKSRIERVLKITQDEWVSNPQQICDHLRHEFQANPVIVRSSALSEDGWLSSAAGAYESILNVNSGSSRQLTSAIESVFRSYGPRNLGNQVLVQPMLSDVRLSGVVMTRTPTTGSAYYVLNYDESSRTDSITSGNCPSAQTVFLHRSACEEHPLAIQFCSLLKAVREVEHLVGHDSLDIEFAVTGDETGNEIVHVLQVRPISDIQARTQVDDETVSQALYEGVRLFRESQEASPFVAGSRTAFNVMSDWNPAEIIGTKPRRLAYSLYRHLIMDELWARQRAEFGYRDVRPCNLLLDFCGHPYVDLRSDFNSFIPASVPHELAARLADFYLDELQRHPEWYDKVEFEVACTCWTFDLDEQFDRLRKAGFTKAELQLLERSLHEITREGLKRCQSDFRHLETIECRYSQIRETSLAPLEKAHLLLEEIRMGAALTFAHLARNAFVAVSLLRSLERIGITTANQTETFLSSVHTVSTELKRDAAAVARNSLSWIEFVEKYGHLRPGTYEITSPSYGQAPEEYLRPLVKNQTPTLERILDFIWDDATCRQIDDVLKRSDLGVDSNTLEEFCQNAIAGREFGKFLFTRHLSLALERLAEFGMQHGITREQLADIRIQDLFACRGAGSSPIAERLRQLAEEGSEAYRCTQSICLPSQIFSADDLAGFQQGGAEPNFVTGKTVQGPALRLSPGEVPGQDVSGHIVMITNADPGYDWLFSREILGLVTMYGGINSHMAVRAAEFALPAAIGIGEALFKRLGDCDELLLDCAGGRIQPLREERRAAA